MATPSPSCPLRYIIKRQYNDRISINKDFLRERLSRATNLYRKDLLAHYGCVNAIEFSNTGRYLVSGGDDRRVLIWNVEQAIHGVGTPSVMRANHISNIFCLAFDSTNSKVFSAGNDDQVIVHDAATGDPLDFFLHEQPVYGLSIDPLNDCVFASACDDGRILLYDIRESSSTEPFCLARYNSAFHAVMFNPVEPRILTTANSKEGVGLWDVRKPLMPLIRYGGNSPSQSCMSVRFNQAGNQILALRRRLPPVLYSVRSSMHICQFDHPGYYNSCTMKSCSFAGDEDQYVLSGSDDFNLYMWKIPPSLDEDQWIGRAHMILHGHRSIVNQVRFHPKNCIIASSGVEKLIKIWSPYQLPESVGSLVEGNETSGKQRKVFTHEEYINLVLRTGQFMTHDYSHQSTKEDPRMMAFFDSLVQREIEGWISEESHSSEVTTYAVIASQSDSDSIIFNANIEEPAETEPQEAQNRISQLIARKRAQLIRHAKSRNENDGFKSKKNSTHRGRYTSMFSDILSDSSDSDHATIVGRFDGQHNDNFRNRYSSNVTSRKGKRSVFCNGKYKSSVSKSKKKTELKKHRVKYLIAYSDSSEEDNDAETWRPNQRRRKPWRKALSIDKKPTSSKKGISKSIVQDHIDVINEASTSGVSVSNNRIKSTKKMCKKRGKFSAHSKIEKYDHESSSSEEVEKDITRKRKYKCKMNLNNNSKFPRQGVKKVGNYNGFNSEANFEDSQIEMQTSSSLGNNVIENTVPMSRTSGALTALAVSYDLNCLKSDRVNGNYSTGGGSDGGIDINVTEGDVGSSNSNVNNLNSSVDANNISGNNLVYSTPSDKKNHCFLDECKTPDSGIALKECNSTGSTTSINEHISQPSCSSNDSILVPDVSPLTQNGTQNWTGFKGFKIKSRIDKIRRNLRNRPDDSDSA